ncbi:MAG: helix-turn-helix transcriptional regulator [Desulfopila sp.]
MSQADRIHELLEILQSRRYGIKVAELADQLQCSTPTVKRYIAKLRAEYRAPIRYDPGSQGYLLDRRDDHAVHLPGLWFNLAELHALITIHELIDRLDPGLLKMELAPLRDRIESLLIARGMKVNELARRFQFQGVGIRLCCPNIFRLVTAAAMERKRLKLRYHSRGKNSISTRQVSPQRLIYYRGNWYLAVFCHSRNGLRILALDRMSEVVPLDSPCLDVAEAELENHLTTSFGIFAGAPRHWAVLRFTSESARWVAEEKWHPDQQGRWLEDGSYQLRLPYADQRELVMEILRHGPDVVVESPSPLRQAVVENLQRTLVRYEEKM